MVIARISGGDPCLSRSDALTVRTRTLLSNTAAGLQPLVHGNAAPHRFKRSPDIVFLGSFNTNFYASKECIPVNLQPRTQGYQFPAQKSFISFSGISSQRLTLVGVASESWPFEGVTR